MVGLELYLGHVVVAGALFACHQRVFGAVFGT